MVLAFFTITVRFFSAFFTINHGIILPPVGVEVSPSFVSHGSLFPLFIYNHGMPVLQSYVHVHIVLSDHGTPVCPSIAHSHNIPRKLECLRHLKPLKRWLIIQ